MLMLRCDSTILDCCGEENIFVSVLRDWANNMGEWEVEDAGRGEERGVY